MRWVDLHVHSNKSDGTLPPTELVSLARRIGLSAFALTDHDSTQGVEEAVEAGRDCGVEVIPGIEVSTEYDGTDVHIVGLAFDWKSPVFQERLTGIRLEGKTGLIFPKKSCAGHFREQSGRVRIWLGI